MKILSSQQIREADKYTIKQEPISSADLMERASAAFVEKFLTRFDLGLTIKIFCGTGNNGGDGLAIGRLLREKGLHVLLYVVGNTREGSEDFRTNLQRSGLYGVIKSEAEFPEIDDDHIIIDGLFGSGLSRPLAGLHKELVDYLNKQDATKIAIDVASGLFADKAVPLNSTIFKPDETFTFQLPKLAFFLPESVQYVGIWHVLDIGLDHSFIKKQKVAYLTTEPDEMERLIPFRSTFTHKNEVGKLTIVGGSKGKIGATVLCASASFKSGVGLVNVCVPKCGIDVLQVAIPEAMVLDGGGTNEVHKVPVTDATMAIGPGLGTKPKTLAAMQSLLEVEKKPLVIDADGINMLSEKKELLRLLPSETILTPHPGEFKRLVDPWKNDFDKLEKLRTLCIDNKLNVVLKGAFSACCNSNGEVYFNPTGNPALATAGSGDVLTGIVGSFLAQGLLPFDALRLGVYIHGLAGDLAVSETLIPMASDIANYIPVAISNTAKSFS